MTTEGATLEVAGDVDMTESTEPTQAGDAGDNVNGIEQALVEVEEPEHRPTFSSYLMSPIVTLVVGSDADGPAVITAHQALLKQSPYFSKLCDAFEGESSLRSIELAEFDVESVGCFLEYLYTGEYFPKKLPGQRTLEPNPTVPSVDDTGDQLLKHARIYTLAGKLEVPGLKTLASSKIHCINSTAKGEIAYARYVYAYTSDNDTTIRAPVASFWATRSYALRSETEDEFKALCLEHPQFGYDVLTRVLDDKIKRDRNDKMHSSSSSHRKRPRNSSGARDI